MRLSEDFFIWKWPRYFIGFVFCGLHYIWDLPSVCSMKSIVAFWENLILHVSLDCLILIYLIFAPYQPNCKHISDRFVSLLYFSVDLFISVVYVLEANHCVSANVKRKGPLFPPGIRILQVSAGPVEAAGNGSRHRVACLYHCNRQVGPGEWPSLVLMPLASPCLLLDEQSDGHILDPPSCFCVHPCAGARVCVCVHQCLCIGSPGTPD